MVKSSIASVLVILCLSLTAQHRLSVAANGSAQFTSIQAAIDQLPNDDAIKEIYISPGIYREKLFIDKNKVKLIGKKKPKKGLWWKDVSPLLDKNKDVVYVIISEARDIWRCDHNDDWGAAAINVRANDVTIENIVAANTYGYDLKEEFNYECKGEIKRIRKDGHQFALRTMPPTQRLTVRNSNFYCLGGDTVSPWDAENGSYYFKDCTMEGGVDFYCPRGWAYAKGCHFICHNNNAAIWHDGSGGEQAISVIKKGVFVGDPGYKLGRYHRDAQIYLIDCKFSEEMADADIYQVSTANVLSWGRRIFYYNSKKEGKKFAWYADNISKQKAKSLTKNTVLDDRWFNPQPYVRTQEYALPSTTIANATKVDSIAEKMLIAQRAYGGWPKTLDGKTQPPQYKDKWTLEFTAKVQQDKNAKDGTIDNGATCRELTHLLKAFRETSNPAYLESIKQGLAYLVEMQYEEGGFPQFYPDLGGYRNQITYNDDAMVNALQVFRTFVNEENKDLPLGNELRNDLNKGIQNGIACLLKTQLTHEGVKTAWAAQYDHISHLPATARIYEHPSYATKESVAIIKFLMKTDNPSTEVKEAIRSGVRFLDQVKLEGLSYKRIKDLSQESGIEVELKEDKNAPPIWARFYDLEALVPIFSGRDGIKRNDIFEIENERRVHYGWYGTWADDLLEKEYPRWHETMIGRAKTGITGIPDTSYNMNIALAGVLKMEASAKLPKIDATNLMVQKNLVYTLVGNRELHIDVITNKAKSKPKTPVLMIHGGGWRSGNKGMHTDLANALALKGHAVFLVEYRLSTEALYPAPIEDLRNALKFIGQQKDFYTLDLDNVVVMGFSAGGQLAALLASSMDDRKFGGQNISNKGLPKIKAFVDMDGITAFIHPESAEGKDTKKISAASHWFGAPAAERPDLYNDGSALHRLGKQLPMALFIASSEKRMQAGWQEYREKLDAAGVYNDYLKFENAPHSFVFFEPWFTPMIEKIDIFLNEIKKK